MEFIDLLRYFGALLLVLAMVGGAGLLARRFGVPGVTKAASDKRLAIVETLMVGPRQRLFIVRRDNVEHLVLSGPDGASVLETGIPAKDCERAMTFIKRLLPFLLLLAILMPAAAFAAPLHMAPANAAAAAATTGRQWRTFHRPQRQRAFHRPHAADRGADHGPVHRALDHHHDDQLCAHRGGAVACCAPRWAFRPRRPTA